MTLHIEADGTVKLPADVIAKLGHDFTYELGEGAVTLRPGQPLSTDAKMASMMRGFHEAGVTEDEIAAAVKVDRAGRG